MIEIGTHKLKKSFGANQLFEKVSFEVKSNERIGLIGQNGTGKTTLMKILIGDESYEGDLFLKKGIKLSYLNQIPEYDDEDLAIDVLSKAFKTIQDMRQRMTYLEQQMGTVQGNRLNKIMESYSELQTKFEISGGYDREEKLGKIMTGLNLLSIANLTFKTLSGGEKTRVMLGKVLLEEPDVLLLDEPTNHLDIEMIGWLEGYLKKYNGAAVIISHDRYFLDRVVNRVIELHRDGVELYNGNYSDYREEKKVRYELAMKQYENQQKKIKSMEDQIKRYRIWGNMRDSEKMYRKAKELEKRLDKVDKIDKPTTKRAIKLHFEEEHRSGKRVFELSGINKTYGEVAVLKNVNLNVMYQDFLTIIGANGTGKSTLLNIIRKDIEPDCGTLYLGSRLKVGYLPQEIVFENEKDTVLDTYQKQFNCTNGEARQALAGVLFKKDDVFKPVEILSGGEKSRLKLLMLMDEQVNVLLLDEPTNHLDIESREMLEESLLMFDGTIVSISHDRYFINKLSNRIAEIKDLTLTTYNGNFEYFQWRKTQEIEQLKKQDEKRKTKATKQVSTDKKISQKEVEKNIQTLQSVIEAREKEVADVISEMSAHGNNLEQLQTLHKQKESIELEIGRLYEELEQLL